MKLSTAMAGPGQLAARLRRLRLARRRRSLPPQVWVCGTIIIVIVAMALLAEVVAPSDPLRADLALRTRPPTLSGNPPHLFGTDQVGRDVFSRTVYGARITLLLALAAVVIDGLLGTTLGLLSGYFGRAVDEAIMTIADIQLAFPFILLAIAIIAVLGPNLLNLVIVVGISGWVTYARITRAQAMSLREKEFVEAVHCLGGSHFRIVFRHILPNTFSPLIVIATLDLARIIILESTLSFLGLGVQPPAASWGTMLGDGRDYLDTAWWIATFPGIVLVLTTLSVSRIGDWLRDVLDPTLREV